MKSLLKYLKPYYKRMGLGLFIKSAGTMVELALPYILSHILKNVVGLENVKLVVLWGLLMVVCAGAACLCNIVANRMAARVSRNFSLQVRHDLFARTLRWKPGSLPTPIMSIILWE